jgi:hypothetical protein
MSANSSNADHLSDADRAELSRNWRLYRAHVEGQYGSHDGHDEVTVFVEAASHREAADRIARSLAASQPHRQELRDSIYNCSSAAELIEQGESADVDLRLFEVGWGGGQAPVMCRAPVFLVRNVEALASKWAQAIAVCGRRTRELAERGRGIAG